MAPLPCEEATIRAQIVVKEARTPPRSPAMRHPDFDPEYVFSHHHATPEQLAHYQAIHDGAKRFAAVLIEHTPHSPDLMTALQLLRETSMIACAAVSLEGRLTK